MKNKRKKVMVIGLDGCTFDILLPMIEKGILPNLERLIKKGTSGPLESTIPPLSHAAWTTFQTGKNPGKHGIFDFFRNDPSTNTYTAINSTFLNIETFWERLSRLGRSVGILNFFFTYPPKEVNGYVISGRETPSEKMDYTSPSSLKEEILRVEPDFEVNQYVNRVSQSKYFLRKVPGFLKCQERVNSYLIEKYPTDLFMNVFPMPDIIQHHFWKYIDPSHPLYEKKKARKYYPLIEEIFQTLDEIVEKRVEGIDEDTVVIIMSDHGFGGIHKKVHLNRWLMKENLLSLRKERSTKEAKFSILKSLLNIIKKCDKILAPLDIFGFRRKLRVTMRKKRNFLPRPNIIDWSKTKAYVGRISENGIHCNVSGREKNGIISSNEEYENVRNHIISGLRELRDPQTGQTVFSQVHKREDIYEGEYIQYAPDIIYETAGKPYEIVDKLFGEDIFCDIEEHETTGKHNPDGIFIVYGKDIIKGGTVQGTNICDLAPTILYMMGEKVPIDMDGKVLKDIFADQFLSGKPVNYDESDISRQKSAEKLFNREETAEIEQRMKDLGYL